EPPAAAPRGVRGVRHRLRRDPLQQGARGAHDARRRRRGARGGAHERRDQRHQLERRARLRVGRAHHLLRVALPAQLRELRRHRRDVQVAAEPAADARGLRRDRAARRRPRRHRADAVHGAGALQGPRAPVGQRRRPHAELGRAVEVGHRAGAQLHAGGEHAGGARGARQREARHHPLRRVRPDRQGGDAARHPLPGDRRLQGPVGALLGHRRPQGQRAVRERDPLPAGAGRVGGALRAPARRRAARRGDRRGHGHPARAALAAAGGREQLRDHHAGHAVRDVGQAHGDLLPRDDRARVDRPDRRRRRRGGDHDDLGHRAHPRDRRPQGARRHPRHDPLPVPDRGRDAHRDRRRRRAPRGLAARHRHPRPHADRGERPRLVGRRRPRRERDHRGRLRPLP
ncbi:MAG: ABC-type antimicrobial peptide transport system, permease component, partial [uncultured Gemmatimonadaceae bacterium]